jgi:hypothetical protein
MMTGMPSLQRCLRHGQKFSRYFVRKGLKLRAGCKLALKEPSLSSAAREELCPLQHKEADTQHRHRLFVLAYRASDQLKKKGRDPLLKL